MLTNDYGFDFPRIFYHQVAYFASVRVTLSSVKALIIVQATEIKHFILNNNNPDNIYKYLICIFISHLNRHRFSNQGY